MPGLQPVLDAAVEHHWQTALRRHKIFNGRVFSADRISADRIEGHWTEYRRIVAQMADPGLVPRLRVRSLAACGILYCPDGVAIGRREPNSVYQPGLWQLPPAGSVDQSSATPTGADWRHALLKELEEELGIGAEHVIGLRPLILIQHPTGVLDLGVRIDTRLRGPEIKARHADHGDREYDRLEILTPETLAVTIEAQGGQLVPAARLLLPLPHAGKGRGQGPAR